MNTLYTFGCSFTEDFENIIYYPHIGDKPSQLKYVDEILNGKYPPTWSKVLSNLLGFKRVNKAQGGSSNLQIFENVCKESSNFKKDDIVIIQWTHNSRFRWPSDTGWTPVLPSLFHDGIGISIETYEEILVSRTHKLYREEIYNYQNLINTLSDSVGFNVLYFAKDENLLIDLPKNKKLLLSEYFDCDKKINITTVLSNMGVTTVTQETNGLVSDGHYGKDGHQKLGEIFYEYIKILNK
jgi:hypothetical protein